VSHELDETVPDDLILISSASLVAQACGLRWAKRNAGNIPRRKPKDKDKDDEKEGMPSMDTESLYDTGMMDMT